MPRLVVSISNARHCFVAVPRALAERLHTQALQGAVVLSCAWESDAVSAANSSASSTRAFVGWSGGVARDGTLEVPSALARCLALREGQSIVVDTAPSAPVESMLFIEPVSGA